MQIEVKGNQLKSTSGFCTPALTKLYASDNHISEIKDLVLSPKLSVLHLRNNRLNSLEGVQSGSALSYLNVRYELFIFLLNNQSKLPLCFSQNQITRFSELDKLGSISTLKHLVLMGNPIANEEIYRLESLFRVVQITRLDKDAILAEDREEVEAVSTKWLNGYI